MSEYWVSKKRYFCKYCDVYIADDAPSRQHHENGLRHKGNVERFVRGLYKTGEKRKKEAEEEKREMQRIEQAAGAAFAQDVGAGRARFTTTAGTATSAEASSSQKPRKAGGISDYSTAESLGYTDPDIERARAEAERRRTQGVVGDWQYVEPAATEPAVPNEHDQIEGDRPRSDADPDANNKRPAPDEADEEEGRWKLRKKATAVGLGEIYDPGIISIKPKVKAEVKEEETNGQANPAGAVPASAGGETKATAAPKWTPVRWKKAGEPVDAIAEAADATPVADSAALPEEVIKTEVDDTAPEVNPHQTLVTDSTIKSEEIAPLKVEEPEASAASPAGSLFRKRKTFAGGGASSRGRRF
ncbi:hypothetical protein BC834DRAFT_1040162 [Gloeopeniophorella convolvens]|nr:hypothetical protein BC834DRAFT_1040162 [Gloeopeniophorella convolvens]